MSQNCHAGNEAVLSKLTRQTECRITCGGNGSSAIHLSDLGFAMNSDTNLRIAFMIADRPAKRGYRHHVCCASISAATPACALYPLDFQSDRARCSINVSRRSGILLV